MKRRARPWSTSAGDLASGKTSRSPEPSVIRRLTPTRPKRAFGPLNQTAAQHIQPAGDDRMRRGLPRPGVGTPLMGAAVASIVVSLLMAMLRLNEPAG